MTLRDGRRRGDVDRCSNSLFALHGPLRLKMHLRLSTCKRDASKISLYVLPVLPCIRATINYLMRQPSRVPRYTPTNGIRATSSFPPMRTIHSSKAHCSYRRPGTMHNVTVGYSSFYSKHTQDWYHRHYAVFAPLHVSLTSLNRSVSLSCRRMTTSSYTYLNTSKIKLPGGHAILDLSRCFDCLC